WGPGAWGPAGEWEERSRETGLPFIVCNRTGREEGIDFRGAESLVIVAGERRLAHRSDQPVVLTLDWDVERRAPRDVTWTTDRL
ncbi:MAG: carbon-nitrogen hydrolase family protein, partial [Rhodospirillales bacterium]|nr:carbon-nitrogen hydrolase family protein [Rhodospirillales bacterium]